MTLRVDSHPDGTIVVTCSEGTVTVGPDRAVSIRYEQAGSESLPERPGDPLPPPPSSPDYAPAPTKLPRGGGGVALVFKPKISEDFLVVEGSDDIAAEISNVADVTEHPFRFHWKGTKPLDLVQLHNSLQQLGHDNLTFEIEMPKKTTY